MSIDWFTVIAQVLNFLILLALLRRYLFGPITAAMDRREKTIREQVEAAEKSAAAASTEAERLAAQRAEYESQREERIQKLHDDVAAMRIGLEEEVRADVQRDRDRFATAFDRERADAVAAFRDRTAERITRFVSKVVNDLADETLQERIVDTFVARLEASDASRREALARAFGGAEDVTVRTALPLDQTSKDRVRSAIGAALGSDRAIRFVEDSNLVCGIELRTPGHKVAFSVGERLDDLEAALLAGGEEFGRDAG